MKLQQLRYLVEVAQAGLNVSQAAENLHTSQPGISKQIRLLEEELGVDVFVRNGKRIVGVTEPGIRIVKMAQAVLLEAKNLREAGREFSHESEGSLTIATTHTQARYVLPTIIGEFAKRYPLVKMVLHQGNPVNVAEEVVSGKADIAIATEGMDQFADLCVLPCYQWNRCLVVKPGHPLLKEKKLTLQKVAQYPLVTYDYSFTGRSKINYAFEKEGLTPNVVLTALDADVIKTYVELGMGVGIIAAMAYDEKRDQGLKTIDVSHLFENSTTRVGIRKGAFLRQYTYDFIALFAPQLSADVVRQAIIKDIDDN